MFKKSLPILFFCFVLASYAKAENTSWQESHNLEAQANYAGATKAIQKILQNNPRHEYALMRYGWLAYLQKEYNLSIDKYKAALKVNPKSLDSQLGIMLPLMAQGRWQEASNYGEAALKVAPYQYYAHIRLMACKEALLQWNSLYEHAKKIAPYYPSDVSVQVYLARAASVMGNTKEAINAYLAVLERTPGNLEAIRYLASNNVKP